MPKQSGILITSTSGFGISQISPNPDRPFASNPSQISIDQNSISEIGISQIGISQIGTSQNTVVQVGTPKVGIFQIRESQSTHHQASTKKISPCQVASTQFNSEQISTSQVNSLQIQDCLINPIPSTQFDPFHVTIGVQIDPSKVTLPSSISSQQFFSSHLSNHDLTSNLVSNINNSATNIWSNLLQSETSLDITFQITDLPTGQLGEATITGFDPFGRPNAGTILIDYNGNGVGWFIDSTPFENSEFAVQNTEFSYSATSNSDAYGKYDLFTTLLHEIAHLYGFIQGYKPFDHLHHPTAIIDGSHLDNYAHPNDLLNSHLAPGIRKLPSDINIEILKAILEAEGNPPLSPLTKGGRQGDLEHLEALLTSTPLLAAIPQGSRQGERANGNFSISDPNHPNFGWTTRGATTILNGQALLTEGSPFLSNLTQTFVVPEGAKTLQFTLVDAQLGSTQFFPSDAFEVALLDAHSLTSLIDTVDELSFTDAFLNLQNTGKTYLGDDVQLPHATGNSPRTFFIDISHLTPGTEATLFFDLLGFGDHDSQVLIDDVMISTESVIPPATINDPITLSQGQSTIIPIFPDNSDLEEILQTYTIQIQAPARNGTVNIAENGTFLYTPNAGFAGTDTFTYILSDGNGIQTNPTTITVTVNSCQRFSEAFIYATRVRTSYVTLSSAK
ncbi:MAG: Ig-like domain-containing protein [Cyanobacteria bacterium P01_G01_bin.49]